MMIESMAGKSATSHGLVHDATPFTYTEDDPPIAYFGKMLTAGKCSLIIILSACYIMQYMLYEMCISKYSLASPDRHL